MTSHSHQVQSGFSKHIFGIDITYRVSIKVLCILDLAIERCQVQTGFSMIIFDIDITIAAFQVSCIRHDLSSTPNANLYFKDYFYNVILQSSRYQ